MLLSPLTYQETLSLNVVVDGLNYNVEHFHFVAFFFLLSEKVSMLRSEK